MDSNYMGDFDLVNYYYIPFFFLAFSWIGLNLIFIILTISQLVKFIKEEKFNSIKNTKTLDFRNPFSIDFLPNLNKSCN
jgi:hypothetical protein